MDLQQILEMEKDHRQRRFRVSKEEYNQIHQQAGEHQEALAVVRRAMPDEEKTMGNPTYRDTIVEPHLVHEVNFEYWTDFPRHGLSREDITFANYHFGLQNSVNARIFFYDNVHLFLPKHIEELAKRRVVATRDLSGQHIRDVFVTTFDDPPQRVPNDFYDIWENETYDLWTKKEIDYNQMKRAIQDAFIEQGRGIPSARAHVHINPNDPYHNPSLSIFPEEGTGFGENEPTRILFQAMQKLPLFPADWHVIGMGFQGDEIPLTVCRPESERYETLMKPVQIVGSFGVQLSFPRGDLLPIDPRELLEAYADVINHDARHVWPYHKRK